MPPGQTPTRTPGGGYGMSFETRAATALCMKIDAKPLVATCLDTVLLESSCGQNSDLVFNSESSTPSRSPGSAAAGAALIAFQCPLAAQLPADSPGRHVRARTRRPIQAHRDDKRPVAGHHVGALIREVPLQPEVALVP